VAPAWRAARERAERLAFLFLDRDMEELPGARVLATERFLRASRPRAGIALRGVIDRVSEWGGGLLVTDYKKKGTPSAAQIFGGQPTSFQMPFYLALLREAGLPVQAAAYYSIEQARYVWVLGGRRPMADGPALEAALAGLERAVAEMAGRLRAGDFTVARDCPACAQRGVCRARFAVREEQDRALR
jgi:RecB family exonuclease